MGIFKYISVLFFIALCSCSKSGTTPPVAPNNLWDNNNQISVTLTNSDIMAVVGERVSSTISIGNLKAKNYSVTPSLPVGINLNSDSGVIAGIAAVIQPKLRYSINVTDEFGRSAQASIYIQVKPDILISDVSIPEITTVSGNTVDLHQYVSEGKGNYLFEIIDASFGSVSSLGIFTPGTKKGLVDFRVTDNAGVGSQLHFLAKIGVPRLVVNYSNPIEGSPLIMQLSLSGKSNSDSVINYSISLVTAMDNNVSKTPGAVTIPAGETTAQIVIPTYNNKINKDNGVFKVALALDQNLRFNGLNDDTQEFSVVIINTNPPPLVSFSSGTSTFVEYDQTASFTIRLIGADGLPVASTKNVSIDYQLDLNFSNVKNVDHNYQNGTQVFLPGEVSKTISFHLYHDVNGNQPGDPDRLMSFKLLNPINSNLSQNIRHNMTILDPMVIDIETFVSNFILLQELQLRQWNTVQNVLVRIKPTGVIRSADSSRAAFSSGFIQLTYPTTITMQNAGSIIGHGGAGGMPADPNSGEFANYCNQQIPGGTGGNGGAAISVVTPMTIINSGTIFGGGGGGGGGVSAIIGNDGLCTLSKKRISGGSGGVGADGGFDNPLLPGPGGIQQGTSDPDAAYASNGGSGGLPGRMGDEGGVPSIQPSSSIVGKAGDSGYAILDSDQSGNHLVSIRNIEQGIIKGKGQ
jgi:hypothetical protein